MELKERKYQFEQKSTIYESCTLSFFGVDGYDVYNPSIPFTHNGKQYIFGRVERRNEWARSSVRLFENIGKDIWTLVTDSPWYQLEDPYIAIIGKELVMGGTHVRYNAGKIDMYCGYFYKGTDIKDLYYFTTGPDYMKDIRLVSLKDGKIGVFSRPRSEEIKQKYGCESLIGFTVVDSLDELSSEVIANAPYIENLFQKGEWGGCNQVYLLESGKLGCIGHKCYLDEEKGQSVYFNIAFVFDPETRTASEEKIIGTRGSYPAGPAKKTNLQDCAFTSGIVMREDGKVDLYSGIGDCESGRIVIDYPFASQGAIVTKFEF